MTSDAGAPSTTRALLDTLPGRLVVLSALLLLPIIGLQQVVELPAFVETFRKVVSGALAVGLAGVAAIAIARARRRLLWRVRRKLILSYLLLGLVPVVLVVLFALAGSVVLYTNFAAYLFHEGFRDIVDDVAQIAETSAAEITVDDVSIPERLERRHLGLAARYPDLSLAVLPASDASRTNGRDEAPDAAIATAGPWRHQPAPSRVPAWLLLSRRFRGAIIPPGSDDDEPALLVRAVAPTPGGRRLVVVDVPLDIDLVARLHERTGTRVRELTTDAARTSRTRSAVTGGWTLFTRTVAMMDYTEWETGISRHAAIGLEASIGDLYDRLAAVQPPQLAVASGLLLFLLLLGVMLLVVQGSALVLGALLARQITSAVHELFVGTERVRSGDFAHRIPIGSRDQLGELAESFNRMSGSIEHLLHVQREKQRLDDELRIARDIQKSLLPTRPPSVPGITVADLCEPAREVGGDYYDFFELGPRQLGVLVADVAGKGTSAALYMAELRGLMLALSHDERSPRQLLIDVNRRLSAQLDNRSFITMTYAVIDLEAGVLTSARAGHTPLIVVSGGRSEVIMSDGMVVGLRLPGAAERFEQVLVEHTRPIGPGDVVVLYTDGVTEAMDESGELFGDAALARIVTAHQALDPAGIRERVLRDVRAFVGAAEPHDDMTMVILKIGDGSVA